MFFLSLLSLSSSSSSMTTTSFTADRAIQTAFTPFSSIKKQKPRPLKKDGVITRGATLLSCCCMMLCPVRFGPKDRLIPFLVNGRTRHSLLREQAVQGAAPRGLSQSASLRAYTISRSLETSLLLLCLFITFVCMVTNIITQQVFRQ